MSVWCCDAVWTYALKCVSGPAWMCVRSYMCIISQKEVKQTEKEWGGDAAYFLRLF